MMIDGCVENRKSYRYEAVRSAAYLGWWEAPEFRCCSAELKNLSQGAALVDLPVAPPRDGRVFLCMGESDKAHWAEAEVVMVTNATDTLYRIRVSFQESCPYDLFNLAVFGFPGTN